MTDGIIQKVISSMIKKHDFALQSELIPENERFAMLEVINVLEIIQIELIEEIRKQSNDINSEFYYDERSMIALIGDKA